MKGFVLFMKAGGFLEFYMVKSQVFFSVPFLQNGYVRQGDNSRVSTHFLAANLKIYVKKKKKTLKKA